MERFDITIVMPALNEAENIRAAVQAALDALNQAELSGEIIVVDDGSEDGTGDQVRRIMETERRVRLLTHPTPRGIGAAFWAGVAQARGESLCLLPGDNENLPYEIFRYHSLLDSVDVVIPFVFQMSTRSLSRRFLSHAYRLCMQLVMGKTPIRYFNGTVLYRTRVLQLCQVHESGFFFQTDILARLVGSGYLYAEVPYRIFRRVHGESKAVSARSALRIMRGLCRLSFDRFIRRSIRKSPTLTFLPGTKTAARYDEFKASAAEQPHGSAACGQGQDSVRSSGPAFP